MVMLEHLPPQRPDRPAGSRSLSGRTKTKLATEMASGGNFSENEIKEIKREPLPAETSPVSAPDKLVESSESPSAEPLGQHRGAACDGAAASVKEEMDWLASTDNCESKPCSSSEESAVKANVFSFLSFPEKLWQLVESNDFKTIWWGHCGNCIVIDEEIFKVEVLGRSGPQKIFETGRMKSFIRQLNLYGFTKMQQDFQRSASLPEFLAEEDAFSAHRKLLLYHNPNFKRDSPHLLVNCKRRVALKRKATAAHATQAALYGNCPSSSPGIQHGWGADAGEEKDGMAAAPAEHTQTAAPAGPPLPKRQAKATPQASGAHPASGVDAPSLPGPAAEAAGRDEQQPPASSQLPPRSSPSPSASPTPTRHYFLPLMGAGSAPTHQNAPAPRIPWATIPPFRPFAILGPAAAAATAMPNPPDWQPSAAPHCPTCTCSPNKAAAGDGLEP
ncbi:heat shock transcription factor, X-linked-like [Anser cygnoides]|uniref:heat shock transcription factor, X-linked-like n=1 Tax=Anser cygnoides TaxID=8845 RepID=UPI0034D2A2FD